MSLPYIILLSGFLFTLLFGALSWIRREGLSLQFAIEAILLTLLAAGLTGLVRIDFNPIIFLFILYILTMRVRLLADLGTLLARQGKLDNARKIYQIAGGLLPDASSKVILEIDQGVLLMQKGELDGAINVFKSVISTGGQSQVGIKYEAAAHYNLAVTYRKKNMDSQAVNEYNAVLDILPASEYGRRAAHALEKK